MRFGPQLLAAIVGAALIGAPVLAHQDPQDQIRQIQMQLQPQPQGSYLGVHLADIDADRAATLKLSEARGVEVVQVQPNTPAAKAGFKAGDVILTYNGENVLGAQQLGRLVAETPPGRHIKIQYWRDGKPGETVVITAAFQAFPNVFQVFPNAPQPGHAMSPNVWPENNLKLQADLMRLRASELAMEIPTPIMVWQNSVFGLRCEPLEAQLAQYFGVKGGVLVRSVEKDGPADKAGVKAGDILISIEDHAVSGPRDVTSFMRGQSEPLKSVRVEVIRNHKPLTLHIPISQEPQ